MNPQIAQHPVVLSRRYENMAPGQRHDIQKSEDMVR